MQAQEYKIVVNRVFSDNGKTLEDIYIEYMAGKIAEVIKEINRESQHNKRSLREKGDFTLFKQMSITYECGTHTYICSKRITIKKSAIMTVMSKAE